MANVPCEQCGTRGGVTKKKHSDGKSWSLCFNCRSKRSKEADKVAAEAYRKKKRIIKERGERCEECQLNTSTLELHHKKRKTDGGDNSDSNLILLCGKCHKKKHSGFLW